MPSIVKYMELRSRFLSIFFIQAMVRIMTPRHPFNKPAQEVIVDLLNQVLVKQFAYNTVTITPTVTDFTGPSCIELTALWPRHMCRERASFSATVEGYKNALQCNYFKVRLDGFIPFPAIEGDASHSEEMILTSLQERYQVFLDPEEVIVDVYGLPTDDGSHRCLIRPSANHLVWAGPLEVRLVPPDHMALYVDVYDIGDLDLSGDADIAQSISDFQPDGYVVEPFYIPA